MSGQAPAIPYRKSTSDDVLYDMLERMSMNIISFKKSIINVHILHSGLPHFPSKPEE